MDKKLTYICDPEKNVNCPKSICKALGRGECMYTAYPKFAVNPDQPEVVINGSYEKKQTNQDKLAESIRTMDPEILAKYIRESIICGEDCPVMDICKPKKGETCYDLIELWLKEEIK